MACPLVHAEQSRVEKRAAAGLAAHTLLDDAAAPVEVQPGFPGTLRIPSSLRKC